MSPSETLFPHDVIQRRGHKALPQTRSVIAQALFRQVIDHERARSDRSGCSFALVIFKRRHESSQDSMATARIIAQRLRAIDELGALSTDTLAALLPYSTAEDGWRVADDVISSHPLTISPPTCEVYVYPSSWSGSEIEDDSVDEENQDRPIKPMEPLFAQPVPWWKRLIDIVGSAVGLLMLSPLLLFVAAAIKLTSSGPILFTQVRTGLGGRRFRMLKFRTMQTNAEQLRSQLMACNEQDGPAFKVTNDPRVTSVGRVLRIKSIDELPQLWNVLKGEMTLVGPRPLPVAEAEACEQWQWRRHDVTPGLTCFWQILGRSRDSFADWMRLDLKYIREHSLWTDLKILALTLPVVIFNRSDR